MKRMNYLLVFALLSVFALSSCDKDKKDDIKVGEFNTLTVEQNKENLEDESIKLVGHMTDLKDCESGKAAESFVSLMDMSDPLAEEPAVKKSKPIAAMYYLAGFSQDKISAVELGNSLKSTKEEGDPETIAEVWEEISGTYEWNVTEEDWDITEGGNIVVFKFPSTENGTVNNVVYTIHPYTGTTQHNIEDYEGELPTSVKSDLFIGDVKEMELEFSASYDTDGIPTNVTATLFLNPFTLAASASNTTSKATTALSIKKGDEVVIDFSVSANGNFTQEAIENVDEDANVGVILQSVEGHIQVENMKLMGNANVKAIADGEDNIYANEDDEDFDWNNATEQEIELFNANYSLGLYYVSDGTKVANSEFYTYTEPWTYTEWVYNETTDEYDEVEVTIEETNADIRLVFEDGTNSDLETYFEEGFNDLEKALNDFIEEIENQYSVEIENVEF